MASSFLRSVSRHPLRFGMAALVLAAGAIAFGAHAAPFGHGRDHGGGFMGGPRIERLLDGVNASAEQRTQIKSIMDAARADLKSQHEAARSLHEQSLAIFTQPTVDARAAEALRQQMLAQHDAGSKRMLQAMLDVSRVLTPEQRQQLGAKMAERKAAMERHRAEHGERAKPQQ